MSELDTLEEEQLWLKSMRILVFQKDQFADAYIELLQLVGFDMDDVKAPPPNTPYPSTLSEVALKEWLDARLEFNEKRIERIRNYR